MFQSTLLFQWKEEDGKKWGYIILFAWETGTFYDIVFGNVIRYYVKGEKVYFPFVWARLCASLDTVSGSLVLLVDGKVVLEERGLQEVTQEDQRRPTDLDMKVGYENEKGGFSTEFTGQYSNLNIFSGPLPIKKMIAMTQAGSPECGAPGDFLSWEGASHQ